MKDERVPANRLTDNRDNKMASTDIKTVNVAILGAGVFVTEQHLPNILSIPNASLKALYSRSSKTVHSLLEKVTTASLTLPSNLDLYADNLNSGKDDGFKGDLKALLSRDDIHAVVIALPILVQPEVIKQCLLAGKHVLSEKPVAPTVAAATELVNWYNTTFPTHFPIWSIAENYRYQSSWTEAAKIAKERLGGVRSFELRVMQRVEGGKYWETEWRKVPGYQGGFVLDGGIHWIAALRDALGEDGKGEWSLSAQTEQICEWLPPCDTVRGVVRAGPGISGTINISFGAPSIRASELLLECEKGIVRVSPRTIAIEPNDGEKETKEYTEDWNGVKREQETFFQAVRDEKNGGDQRQGPVLAWEDLELTEGLLESGRRGGERIVARGWQGVA